LSVVGESSFPDILAVDDTPNNLSLLAELLKDRYRVRIATNGAKAIELAIAHPPDLILLDIMMPGLNGYEVLERLRADARLRHIPVIMISAVGEIESVIRCIELGAEDYLPKPFNPTLLKARVGASLERKRLHDAIQAQAEQLADWNRKLEQRVGDQVAELERLARLKRFFAPTLVEAILDRGGEELLKMHRREVVVTFLDLRGFSQFTERCEPEEVVRVLAAYHQEMGELIIAYEGTLERFAGDGMMVFFNDPIVLNNPAHNAVLMALAMQERFRALRADWAKRGYELDLGIGIAQGYATLGAIGFESRWDYACIGSVSNLAARLCGEAKGGQILTEQKTIASVEDLVQAEFLGELTFKGIPYPTRVFNVTACTRPPDPALPTSAPKAPAGPARGADGKYRDR
jgi:class 3 adenylate cyclase/CheY-like chemotaxis protein